MALGPIVSGAGFDQDCFSQIEPSFRRNILLDNAWSFAGIGACGVSGGYLAWFCTGSPWGAGIAALVVAVVLWALQGMVLTGTGIDASAPAATGQNWRPANWRAGLFVAFGLLFSQPILIYLYQRYYAADIPAVVQSGKQLQLDLYRGARQREVDELLRAAVLLEERSGVRIRDRVVAGREGRTSSPSDLRSLDLGQGRRKALLIGNNAYASIPRLENAVKDASDLARALRKIGFEVQTLTDGTRMQMEVELDRYVRSLQPGDISLIHFSGHAFQNGGNNYLMGIDFTEVGRPSAVALNGVVEAASYRKPLANVIILDACRDYAPGGTRGGLAATEAGQNTYIAFAAAPGKPALEPMDAGANGFFTGALLRHIEQPKDIDTIFRDVRTDVARKTRNQQETWTTHNLKDELILASDRQGHVKEMHSAAGASASGKQASQQRDPVKFCVSKYAALASDSRQALINECLVAEALKLGDEIDEHRYETNREAARLRASAEKSGASVGELLTLFFSAWSHPFFSFLGTVVLTLAISGGFVRRDAWPRALISYETAKRAQTAELLQAHASAFAARAAGFPLRAVASWARGRLPDEQIDDSENARRDMEREWGLQPG